MAYARRLVLHAPPWNATSLIDFVEACMRDRVVLICVVGHDCKRVEDVIDELIVGDGSDDTRFITTTSHADESVDEVINFAAAWTLDNPPGDPVEEVRLRPF